jgi:hypothetical protein
MAVLNRFLSAAIIAAATAAAGVRSLSAQVPETVEDEVKAAYVFNFTKFVEWPSSAFTGTTDPINICVAGDAGVIRAMERTIGGEHVEGRPLRAVSQLPEDPSACHVLFLGRGADRAARLLAATGKAPVLTIGDSTRFLQLGGMIAFVVENRRVRFDINMRPAARVGLKLSSKLLRVARNVRENGPGR